MPAEVLEATPTTPFPNAGIDKRAAPPMPDTKRTTWKIGYTLAALLS
jgi:hypothetical protein